MLKGLLETFPLEGDKDVWRRDPKLSLRRTLEFNDRPRSVMPWPNGIPGRVHSAQLVSLDLRVMRLPNRAQSATRLTTVGDNLTNVFASLPCAQQSRLVGSFIDLIPLFSDLNARPTPDGSGSLELIFTDRWNAGLEYRSDDVSDGTMFTLALLLASCSKAHSHGPAGGARKRSDQP